MDLKTGYPYWLIKNGLPFQYPKLLKNIKSDVVIIGGGISGAFAAHYLTQKGIPCIILDKRTVGLGSTCASTSLVQYELDKPLCELKKIIGNEKAGQVYISCVQAVNVLLNLCKEIGFTEVEANASLYYAAFKKDAASVEREFIARKQIGIDVKLLDESAIKKKYGFKSPRAIESSCGLSADVYMLSHALCRNALKKGLEIYDRSTVIKIEENRQSVKVHTEDGFHVNCKYVVNASGYEAGDFLHKNIVRLISTYAIASENIDDPGLIWKNRAMLWNTADPYLYMRLTKENRIILGGRDENICIPAKRDALINYKSLLLQKDFKKLFAHIPFKTEFSWAGTFGVTKDSLPYIGTIKNHPRIYYALGYGGNGILFSQLAAEIISDAITGKKNKNAALFSFERA